RAARVVISGMNAKLIDSRCGIQNAQRIKEMYVVPLLGQTYGSGRAVDSGAGDGDFQVMLRHACREVSSFKFRVDRVGLSNDQKKSQAQFHSGSKLATRNCYLPSGAFAG